VVINGDRTGEPSETVAVSLGQASGGAVVGDGQGAVTIVDDEPRMGITDVGKNEGNGGNSSFTFVVTLSSAYDVAVSVNFTTADGSATAGEDYVARAGTLTFNPGETSNTIVVNVTGDRKLEELEVFYVNLSGGSGAFVADNQAYGYVRNDDK
jgi:hypothetical protein